jgi:hypothetical protein
MSRKLQAACEGELGILGRRLGFLLERPELADDANPVSPATVCSALRDACDQIESGLKARVALLNQLEHHAEAELRRIYSDLNAHLVARSILPDGVVPADGATTQPTGGAAPTGRGNTAAGPLRGLVLLSRDSASAPAHPRPRSSRS